jgi:hypothetical protein
LHELGMSIIKLDGVYRGIYEPRDVEALSDQLDPSEVEEFSRPLYSKPYGENVLKGWRKYAFMTGLL